MWGRVRTNELTSGDKAFGAVSMLFPAPACSSKQCFSRSQTVVDSALCIPFQDLYQPIFTQNSAQLVAFHAMSKCEMHSIQTEPWHDESWYKKR
jgi:hypothetical protein